MIKLGFYDSGLGGLSVLRKFIQKFGTKYQYLYIGDSARAPYGERSPEELKSYILEFADLMQGAEVDLMISACNTSSMYLHEVDLDDYSFEVISLFDVMKKYFTEKKFSKPVALLATNANIASERYKNWDVDIYPIRCPKLVPLIEAGKLDEAKAEWNNYLKKVPEEIDDVIVGCTHYSFLVGTKEDRSSPVPTLSSLPRKFSYIDPADIVVEQFTGSVLDFGPTKPDKDAKLDVQLYFTLESEEYRALANKLLYS